jgi:hypothetical protein
VLSFSQEGFLFMSAFRGSVQQGRIFVSAERLGFNPSMGLSTK